MVEATGQATDWAGWSAASASPLNARVEPFTAESLARYRRFALPRPCGTAQQPAWVEGWANHAVGDGFFVSVTSGEATWLMLPLEVARSGPCRIARIVGGKHANANFPALAPMPVGIEPRHAAEAVVRAVRRARPDIDILLLERLAADQEGRRNPLLTAGARQSVNIALSVPLHGDFDAVLARGTGSGKARRQRRRLKKLEAAGGYRRFQARDAAEVRRLLSFFFACKSKWFEATGIPDVFAAKATQEALIDVFTRALDEEKPSFLLHGLEVGGVLRAVGADSHVGNRLICQFSAFADDELAVAAPGQALFHMTIEDAWRRGLDTYDFGVGDERYKREWCDVETLHYDVALPVTLKGWSYGRVLAAVAGGKRTLKRHPALWNAFKRLRRRVAGAPPSETVADSTEA